MGLVTLVLFFAVLLGGSEEERAHQVRKEPWKILGSALEGLHALPQHPTL